MKDRTVEYSRPDAGEAEKDIKTPDRCSHAGYEHNENFHVKELAAKIAQALEERPSTTEYQRRQRLVRKIVGTIAGTGYGAVGGGLIGGRTGAGDTFDDKRALIGALMGALGGGALGFGMGTAANKVVEYTGGDQPQQPRIQIVLPPTESVAQRVEDAMKTGSAQQLYMAGFMKRALAPRLLTAGVSALQAPAHANPGIWQKMLAAAKRYAGSYVSGVGTSIRPLSTTAGRGLQDAGMRISPMHSQGAFLAGRATPYVGAAGGAAYGLGQLGE